MHELPLVKNIFQSALQYAQKNNATKITEVYLRIGALRDLVPEYVLHYWKYVSKGTIAEGSTLIIDEIPASAQCSKCQTVYVLSKETLADAKCPKCGYEKGYLLSGREVILDHIEIK